jgi:hypothetical protein
MAKLTELAAAKEADWRSRVAVIPVSTDNRIDRVAIHIAATGWDAVPQYWAHREGGEYFAAAERLYGIYGIPHALLIDADGKIVWRGHPIHARDGRELAERIDSLIGEAGDTSTERSHRTFIDEIAGRWELELIIDNGRSRKVGASHHNGDTLEVVGRTLKISHGSTEPADEFQIEEITFQPDDVVRVMLSRNKDGKTLRIPALIRANGDHLTLVYNRDMRKFPESIEPSKGRVPGEGNYVRVWRRQ